MTKSVRGPSREPSISPRLIAATCRLMSCDQPRLWSRSSSSCLEYRVLVVLDQIGAANLDCVLAKDQYDTNIVTSHKRINHYLHSEDDPVNKDVSQFATAVKRVPLFAGLQPAQAVTLLKVCKRRSLAAGETLCRFGDRSDKMYILLTGELSIRTADDTQIAKLSAVAPVGEMGIFTDEPRSATVVAISDSALFVLEKYQLKNAMRQNKDMEIIISRNVIATLAQRIRESNEELNHLRR